MFEPIRTPRLLLRPARSSDAASLAERRSDLDVARYQAWTTPYPLNRAQLLVDSVAAMSGPLPDEWWMLTITDHDDATVHGDLALHLENEGNTAEIGYTLAREHWGHGYATESVEALAAWLFEIQDVVRVQARIHPDNLASARVLERSGFVFEGRTRLSYWTPEENLDDVYFGLTRDLWEAWRDRPRDAPASVKLVELDQGNNHSAWRLQTHWSQRRLVAPMEASFADMLFPEIIDGEPVVPEGKGIVADGMWVGFVLLARSSEHHPESYLWRLLVDRLHQRRGIGTRALGLVVEQLRARGERSLKTSWIEGPGSPRDFYLGQGYEPTGEVIDGEIEARLVFA